MGRTAIVLGSGIALWVAAACEVREYPEDEVGGSAEPGGAAATAEMQRNGGADAVGRRAEAVLVDATGRQVGGATLVQEVDGVRIAVSVEGLEPGRLGFHIHEHGRCDAPDFESAGGHLGPGAQQHGTENPEGPHAGDLPNLRVGADGRGENETLNPLLSLSEGEASSVLRPGGTSVIIHEETDDYYTDPSGDAGARIACGVIRVG